jgi:hypothetical protein
MGTDTIRFVLEIDAVDDSLTGRVVTSSGEAHQFTGWLGLLGALEALMPVAQPDPDRDRPRQ